MHWAFFGHSVYYFTPTEVAQVLLRTRKHAGIAVCHKFDEVCGTIGEGECTYTVQGGEVRLIAAGDDHGYQHANNLWMFTSDATHFEEGELGRGVRAMTLLHVVRRQRGDTYTVELQLTDDPAVIPSRPFTALALHEQPIGTTLEDVLPEDAAFLERSHVTEMWVGRLWMYFDVQTEHAKRILVPREAMTKLVNYALGRVIDKQFWRDLLAYAKTLFTSRHHSEILAAKVQGHGVPVEALGPSAVFAAYYALDFATRYLVEAGEEFYTLERGEIIRRSNQLASWEDPFVRDNPLRPLYWFDFVGRYYKARTRGREVAWQKLCDDWTYHRCTIKIISFVAVALVTLTMFILMWPSDSRFFAHAAETTPVVQSEPWTLFQKSCALVIFFTLVAGCWWWLGRRRNARMQLILEETWLAHVNENRRSYPTKFKFSKVTGPRPIESVIDCGRYPQRADARISFKHLLPARDPVGIAIARGKYIPGVVAVGVVFSGRCPTVFSRSTHNLIVGIRTRAILDVPGPVEGAWERVSNLMDSLYDLLEESGDSVRCARPDHYRCTWYEGHNYDRVTQEEYLCRYPPRRQTLIRKALRKYDSGTFSFGKLAYMAFVKLEKIVKLTYEEWEPQRPRLIQGLSDLAKGLAGRWFFTYSNALKTLFNAGTRIYYCSGATAQDVNEWFNNTVIQYSHPVFISCDFSKYDVTQCAEAMRREGKFYEKLGFCRNVPEGKSILASKYRARVWAHGIKYSVDGTRKSGDLDTSSGNSKMTCDLIYSFFKHHGLHNCVHMIILGDDNLVIIDSATLVEVFGSYDRTKKLLIEWVRSLGCILKCSLVENCVEAEFLSRRFYPTGATYSVGVKPGRLLSKVGWFIYKNGIDDPTYERYLMGTLLSLRDTSNHVPFARVYVRKLLEYLESRGTTPRYHEKVEYWLKGADLREADESTWAAFTLTYGLTRADEHLFELQIEEALRAGLPYMSDSRFVDLMVDIDFSM
jgi:hypothetical protein